jgi:hypothetical protein
MKKATKYCCISIFLFCGVLTACKSPLSENSLSFRIVQPDSTWNLVNVRGIFSFYIPPGLKRQEVQGYDSYIGLFKSSKLRLGFDYGMSSGIPDDHRQQGYSREETKIDGHRAIIVSYLIDKDNATLDYKFYTEVYFPAAKKKKADGPVNELDMSARCKTNEACAVAQGIFRSVSFK